MHSKNKMLKVQKIAHSRLRHKEHLQFVKQILATLLLHEPAQRIMRIIRQIGNPWKLADQAESTMIIQLGNELNPYMDDIKKIEAQWFLDKLLLANKNFMELDGLCREDKTNRPSGNVKAVRIRLNPVYLSIVSAINSDIDRYKDGRFDALVTALNAIIKEYGTLLAQRKGRKDKDDEIEEEKNA